MTDERYMDWIETDHNLYNGNYVYFEFKASEVIRQENLLIVSNQGELSITHTRNGKQSQSRTVKLNGNSFKLLFKELKGNARFAKRLPLPNAKGEVEAGILAGKKFFRMTSNMIKEPN